MSNLLEIIFYFVIWVLVPLILLIVIWYLGSLSRRTDDRRHKDAIRSGFWAGFILFIMVLIYQVGAFLKTGFPQYDIYQGFNFWLALSATVVVFVLFLGGKKVIPPVLSGLLVLIITFLGFYAFLHYLFIRTYNEILLSLILGATFGVLVHFASSPSSVREFLRAR